MNAPHSNAASAVAPPGSAIRRDAVPDHALCRRDRRVGHQHGSGNVRLRDRKHQLRHLTGAEAVGRQPADRSLDRPAGLQRIVKRGAALGFDADHRDAAGVPGGDAADQSAAAGRNQDMREVRCVMLEFPPDGALPGEHISVIVGMHFQRAGLGLAVARGSQSLGIGRADLARRARHNWRCGRPWPVASAREQRSPPSRRGLGRHTPPPHHGCRPTQRSRRPSGSVGRQQTIECAARLEASCVLQKFQLQRHRQSLVPAPQR